MSEQLTKDKDELLAFYDCLVEYWVHIRTTNLIESRFATVRPRTKRPKGFLFMATMELMVLIMVKEVKKI